MQAVDQMPLPIHPHQPPKHAKPMAIAGAAAIIASIIASIAVVVFGAALMPILLPIAATIAATGVICLTIGLIALKMKPVKESPIAKETPPVEKEKLAEINDLARNNQGNEAIEKFEELPQVAQKIALENFAEACLKDENGALEWILEQKRTLLTPMDRLDLFKKLIEQNKHDVKPDFYARVGHALDLKLEDVMPLLIALCNSYIEHKKFDEAYKLAMDLKLVDSLKVIVAEFVKSQKVVELELICATIDDQQLKNEWLCKLAEVYANMGKMEEAAAKVAYLRDYEPAYPGHREYELTKIRLFAYHDGLQGKDQALKALDDALISIAGGLGSLDNPNYPAIPFTDLTKMNIPEKFIELCKKQAWNSAHQLLVERFETFKNPPPPARQDVAQPVPLPNLGN